MARRLPPVDTTAHGGHAGAVKIYVMRHSDAVRPGTGVPDTYRYLTEHGRRKCREVGRLLREAGVTFDAVCTSPLVRAVQTAELIADAVDYLGTVESNTVFAPGTMPDVTCKALLQRGQSVLLVGHEPNMSSLAAFLAGTPGFAPFRTGQVSLFHRRKPMWKLHPDALQFEDLHAE